MIRLLDPPDAARLLHAFMSRRLGGPGSGNFGHSGRPGQVGGSGDMPGGGSVDSRAESVARSIAADAAKDGRERLVVIYEDGSTGAVVVGTDKNVGPGEADLAILRDRKRKVKLVHTHPNNVSLSPADLELFGQFPSVQSMTVISPDGSVYSVERGARYPELAAYLEDHYSDISSWATYAASSVGHEMQLDLTIAKNLEFSTHVANMALARAGLIRYSSKLSEQTAVRAERWKKDVSRTASSVSNEIRRQMRKATGLKTLRSFRY